MQVREYLAVLTKRWWVIALLVFAAASSAYVYSKMQQPLFRSTAKLFVMARPDYGVNLVIQTVLRQYSQLLETDRFLNKINKDLQLDLSPAVLRKQISAAGTTDNFAIQIDVDNPDPAAAQRISRALAVAFMEDQEVRMAKVDPKDRIEVNMYDEPVYGALVSPKTKVNVLASAVLGLVLGVVTAFLLEYLDDTIKTSEDVEGVLALPVLGSIPGISPNGKVDARELARRT